MDTQIFHNWRKFNSASTKMSHQELNIMLKRGEKEQGQAQKEMIKVSLFIYPL